MPEFRCEAIARGAFDLGIVTSQDLLATNDQEALRAFIPADLAPSGWADPADIERGAMASAAGIREYLRYLAAPMPKAFASSLTGGFWETDVQVRSSAAMPSRFLSDEQLARDGRYTGNPNDEQLARHFHLDAAGRELVDSMRGAHTALALRSSSGQRASWEPSSTIRPRLRIPLILISHSGRL